MVVANMVAVGAFCTARTNPAGGRLSVIFCHPDGSDWFALWSEVAEIGADDSLRFDLWTAQDEYHSTQAGTYPFASSLKVRLMA